MKTYIDPDSFSEFSTVYEEDDAPRGLDKGGPNGWLCRHSVDGKRRVHLNTRIPSGRHNGAPLYRLGNSPADAVLTRLAALLGCGVEGVEQTTRRIMQLHALEEAILRRMEQGHDEAREQLDEIRDLAALDKAPKLTPEYAPTSPIRRVYAPLWERDRAVAWAQWHPPFRDTENEVCEDCERVIRSGICSWPHRKSCEWVAVVGRDWAEKHSTGVEERG